MRVVINKLGSDAVARFSSFLRPEVMDKVPLSEAKKYSNLVVIDQERRIVIFDLANSEI